MNTCLHSSMTISSCSGWREKHGVHGFHEVFALMTFWYQRRDQVLNRFLPSGCARNLRDFVSSHKPPWQNVTASQPSPDHDQPSKASGAASYCPLLDGARLDSNLWLFCEWKWYVLGLHVNGHISEWKLSRVSTVESWSCRWAWLH